MSSDDYHSLYGELEKQLATYASSLAVDFQRAAEELEPKLTSVELTEWAEAGLALAQQSWRSWESATEYFRATGQVLPVLGYAGLGQWTQYGRELTELSSALAASYFRACPQVLPQITPLGLATWVSLGRQLYKGTWRSASLAVQFFDASPELLSKLSLDETLLLVRFIDSLCDRSYDLASYCLSVAPEALHPLPSEDRRAFLEFALTMVGSGWADARSFLEKGPGLLARIHSEQRVRYLELAGEVAKRDSRQSYTYFAEAARALAKVDGESHGQLLALSENLLDLSPAAAMELLKTVPEVLERIHIEDIDGYYDEGVHLLNANRERGEAYFRLETSHSLEVLESLSHRVELHRVRDVLSLYSKALTGADVAIHSAETLTERGIGWVNAEAPSTEGSSIFLPLKVEEYEDKPSNFGVYKVLATHQAGHLEFDSFDFEFGRPAALFPGMREEAEAAAQASDENGKKPVTDMERFFDLFANRRLAADIFTIAEDTRIDAMIDREYLGIRNPYLQVQLRELEKRPPIESLPLQMAFLEDLVRASLGGYDHIRWHPGLEEMLPFLREGLAVLATLRRPHALVEDSAEATIRLYRLAEKIPNVSLSLPEEDWYTVGDDSPSTSEEYGEGGEGELSDEGEQRPYQSPQPVESRGEFKPELVQLLARLRQRAAGETGEEGELSAEDVQNALEKSVELAQEDMVTGNAYIIPQEMIENILKEMAAADEKASPADDDQDAATPSEQTSGMSSGDEGGPLPVEPTYAYYDEWDFRAGDYKPKWCRIIEYPLAEGVAQTYDQTLRRYSALASQTRRQFEMLKPELFRKIRPLLDGEEFDLDATIQYVIDRRSGQIPPGKVYWRRNKIERDVAVAFLLDMSASTDEEISRQERLHSSTHLKDIGDPKRFFSWWIDRRASDLLQLPKRIIDVEKESIVLLIHALETIGDKYAIYGFSGYGRDNVEFYVVKDMKENFGERIKRRIDKIAPVRSTRMGPAIRHTISKLEATDAKVRILFLVSDGRPQDHGYGRDRTEKEYAIHDTHMALLEAKHKGMVPFCLTVDRYGHDYLKQMCDDIGYAVVADVESLPSRITALYRRLTE